MNTVKSQFTDSPRLVSVYNTESEAIPPYAALEVFGWDETYAAFKVRKVTKLSHTDVVFNLGFPVPALSLGSAANTFPLAAAISQRGEDLGAGDVCGTYPGEWYLRSGASGFMILETIAGGRGVAVVVPQTGSLVEYVEPLGFVSDSERPDGLPGNYVNGQLYQLNPQTGLFESQGESIWIAPSAPYKRATLAGTSYNRKVYVADIPDIFTSGSGSGAGGPEHGGPGTIIATIPSIPRCVAGILKIYARDVIEYPDGEISYSDEYYYGDAGCCGCTDPPLTESSPGHVTCCGTDSFTYPGQITAVASNQTGGLASAEWLAGFAVNPVISSTTTIPDGTPTQWNYDNTAGGPWFVPTVSFTCVEGTPNVVRMTVNLNGLPGSAASWDWTGLGSGFDYVDSGDHMQGVYKDYACDGTLDLSTPLDIGTLTFTGDANYNGSVDVSFSEP